MIRNSETKRVAVIGGGLGGLASACTLAARGYAVTVFDKNPWMGGKAAVLKQDGFRFDMGPTILTYPTVLRRIFAEAGLDLNERLPMLRLDPQWRCFYDDGSVLDLRERVDDMGFELERLAPGEGLGERWAAFISEAKDLHEIYDRYFFWRSVESIGDVVFQKGAFPRVLGDVLRIRPWADLGGTVRDRLKDPRVAQMADHFTQYIGSAPDASPAVLLGIAHMQSDDGVWYPKGGIRAVPEALVKLAEELGVEFRTETGVSRILVENDRAVGVVTDTGETVPAAAVVSNMDSVRTYAELIGGKHAERFSAKRDFEAACSGVVLYLGLNESYEHLAHHCFVFSRDPEEEFDAIYNKGEPAPDPTVYICAPSRSDDSAAPPGAEAMYLLVHTPYLRDHHDWDRMLPEYRKVIFDKLARSAGLTDLEDRICFEDALTPKDIHERYRVLNGAIYGVASHGRWSGAFKPANRRADIEGLYLAGGAAHPGPGMPMVLMSGWIAADCLDQDGRVETRLDAGRAA